MIPAAFEYARAKSVTEAVALLKQHGEDAKVLAGGHSLIPLMRLRLAQPTALIDINEINELSYVHLENGNLRVGAMTRHVEIQHSKQIKQSLPMLAEMASEVGDNQVRNMGTIGGVVAHADAAGDYPTLAVMLDAEIITDRRRIPAKDFFIDRFTTLLAPDELICEVSFPVAAGRHKYLKFRRRLFDWAIVAAAAQQTQSGWRIGLTNLGPKAVRATAVEQALAHGATPEEASMSVADGINSDGDIRAPSAYKRHLAQVLTRRAIEQATD